MIIGVAGLYSATESEKKENTAAMNKAAALLCSIGHIPMIGINTAVIPYLENNVCSYNAILQISLAAIDRCEDLLLLAESLGTNKERELILSKALPVFCSIEEAGARTTSPNQKISKQ